jgi:hypothetical protein
MTTMFDDIEAVTAETLVGDGKTYKTVDELAKGKAHADKHIKELQDKLDSAKQGATLAEVLEFMKQGNTQNSQNPPSQQSSAPVVDPTDTAALETQFHSFLQKQKQKEQEEANRKAIQAEMIKKYGPKAGEQFATLATSIGMTTQGLEAFGTSNPQAFFKMAGLDQSIKGVPNVNQSSHNPAAMQSANGNSGKPGTKSWWNKFKEDHPNDYLSPKVQKQRLTDWERDPDYFENN